MWLLVVKTPYLHQLWVFIFWFIIEQKMRLTAIEPKVLHLA